MESCCWEVVGRSSGGREAESPGKKRTTHPTPDRATEREPHGASRQESLDKDRLRRKGPHDSSCPLMGGDLDLEEFTRCERDAGGERQRASE